jgi:putative flavoprotein involved in K+ transport
VVGGGQAGLAAGHYLARQGRNFVILDENGQIGDAWRRRWDNLRLFTPSQYNSLPGLPFPKPRNYFPAKDEVADYLVDYARQFNLPVRHNVKVESLSRNSHGYLISAGAAHFSGRQVVVATGPFQRPHTPAFASALGSDVFQLHSSEYRNPAQIPVKSVLVVGAGNSGAEIALELSKAGKQVWLAGRDVGKIPANSPLGKLFDGRLVWWMMTNLLTVDTPMGRKMQANSVHHGTPLGHTRREELAKAGILLMPRLAGIQAGQPQLEDGRGLPAEGIIWATGFEPDFRWISLPIFDAQGYPRHARGVVSAAPGLYFLGLVFQTGLSSSLLGGVGRDAAYLVEQISHNSLWLKEQPSPSLSNASGA